RVVREEGQLASTGHRLRARRRRTARTADRDHEQQCPAPQLLLADHAAGVCRRADRRLRHAAVHTKAKRRDHRLTSEQRKPEPETSVEKWEVWSSQFHAD